MFRILSLLLCFILLNFLFIDSVRLSVHKNVEVKYAMEDNETEEDNDVRRFYEEDFIVISMQNTPVDRKVKKGNFFFNKELTDVYISLHCPPPNC